jgi:hypothetical protein
LSIPDEGYSTCYIMEINWSSFSVCGILVIRDENKTTIKVLMVKRCVMFVVGQLHDPSAWCLHLSVLQIFAIMFLASMAVIP